MTLLEIARLSLTFARVDRATFHPDGIRPESDTDHTFMLGLLALHIAGTFPELGLDVGRLAALALVHDLPEVYAGDTNTAGGLSPEQRDAKAAREAAAMDRLKREFGASGYVPALMEAYERQECRESRFLRYLDKITPKLTHALNGCIAVRRRGDGIEWLRGVHRRQAAELAAEYPEFVAVLGPLFDEACEHSEWTLEVSGG